MIYQNDCIGQQPGTGYTKLQQNQSNSVVMEAIEMTLRDIGDGVRTRRSTVRHRYRRSIYIILLCFMGMLFSTGIVLSVVYIVMPMMGPAPSKGPAGMKNERIYSFVDSNNKTEYPKACSPDNSSNDTERYKNGPFCGTHEVKNGK